MRKFYILSLIFVLGFAFCFTNGFADNGSAAGFEDNVSILEGSFEFPTPDGAAYIQDTPEFQKVLDNIIGTNDFEKMRDLPPDSQDYILGTKVGMIFTPDRFDPDLGYLCTGFLVGPDLFMTNHHCIHDDFGPLALDDIIIFMDYYQELNVDRTRGGVTAGVSEILRADGSKDYALLRLDKPIGNTYGWLQLDTTTHVDSSQSVKLISHPQGRSKEIVRRNSEIVELPTVITDDYPFLLAYLADSEGGSSGSPVFLRDGTGVIAIHHSAWTNRNTGEPVFNAGSLMSYIFPEIQQYLPGGTTPDLVVEAPRVSKGWLRPSETFTLSATVRNQGGVASSATTLRFYQSFDNIITTADVEVGTASVSLLGPFETSEVSVTLTAPFFPATYYYGACVDAVANEAVTDNNCSTGVSVPVSTTPPVYMYWTDATADKIQRANLDGTNIQDLVTGVPFPRGIAVDVTGGKMYWTDATADKIQRANLDGSHIEDLVTGLAEPLNGLALDVNGNKMYWTDRRTGKIQRANLDGSHIEDLVTGGSPYGLALDVSGGKMYWTEWIENKIQRANLDGSHIEDLVTGLGGPSGLALDVAGNKVYWTDINTRKIQRANLDGSNVEDLVTGLSDPPGLALDVSGGKMYWTEWGENKIQRANLDGSNVEDLVTGLENPFAVALGIPLPTGPPSPPLAFNPPTIADQTFTVGSPVNLTLPTATGGTAPYTYTLSPIPAGLEFVAAVHSLAGIPTTVGVTNVTYTVTDTTGASAALNFTIEVTEEGIPDPLDVNGDGRVTVIDLAIVALFYGTRVPAGISLPADVNADGIVNLADLTAVAQQIDANGGGGNGLALADVEAALAAVAEQAADLEEVAEAPIGFNTRSDVLSSGTAYLNVTHAFADARHLAVSDVLSAFLALLAEMGAIPETTALLPNYPNPFNPETWIPYHLSKDAAVTVTIYNMQGVIVRQLMLGHQPAGVYESRGRAAYWDGKNQIGEQVASGVYFYTLTAGEFNATRKLLIAK